MKRSVETNISIDLRFPLDLPQAYVDANQLEMVLINLVVNARDAMPDGGSICIEDSPEQPPKQEESMRPATSFLSFETTVSVWSRKFCPRYRSIFTTKGPGNGTGLGSMAHGLPNNPGSSADPQPPRQGHHSGNLATIATERQAEQTPDRVESGPGPQLTALPSYRCRSWSWMTILVLDNTASMLEDLGCQVTAVNSAETALVCNVLLMTF